jgi:FkbH-like protein
MTVAPDIQKIEIERLIDAGEPRQALAVLRAYWRKNMRPAAASYVLNRFEQVKKAVPLRKCKLAILRSFTVEPAVLLLKASAAVEGIDLSVHVGAFNAYMQEMLDAESSLYRYEPDVVFLAVQSRDIAPDLYADFAGLTSQNRAEAVERVSQEISNCVKTFRSRSAAHLVLHTLEAPIAPNQGILDWQRRDGQTSSLYEINERLASLAEKCPGIYLLNYEALISEMGWTAWHSEQNWITSKLPLSAAAVSRLATEWLRFLHPLTGRSCKVLAVDLDNTLWAGVVGEDGMNGIRLEGDDSSVAFLNLQRVLLDLYHRGILLAICSKNNAADALEVLEKHPAMLLRSRHFAAMRINWNDKARNLREIADELNVGIDAVAFLDDNPAEREWVSKQEPDVTIIDLPEDPAEYARTVRETPVFERLTISAEDRERNRYYREQRQRDSAKENYTSLRDFYDSLATVVEIAPVTQSTTARVAQLTQKTNQFNVTTKRYNEQEITALPADVHWNVYSVSVRDRFGDHGVVGVAIVHDCGATHEIDTFLLSCRIIGRTVETAMLAYLAQKARESGALKITGEFLGTKKNAPAKDLYRTHGFRCIVESESGSRWELDLADGPQIQTPTWLDVRIVQEVHS